MPYNQPIGNRVDQENAGYQLSGDRLNKMRDELKRLSSIRGSDGVTVINSAMGITISGGAGKANQIKFVKFTGDDYPVWDDLCRIFPAKVANNPRIGDEEDEDEDGEITDCTTELKGVGEDEDDLEDDEIQVFNLGHIPGTERPSYIKQGTIALVYKIKGKYWIDYPGPTQLWGKITGYDMSRYGSGNIKVWFNTSGTGGGEESDITLPIGDNGLIHGSDLVKVDTRVVVWYCQSDDKWYILSSACGVDD